MPAHALAHPMTPSVDRLSAARRADAAAARRRAMRTLLVWSGFVLGATGYVALLAAIISVGLTSAVGA